MKLYISLFNNFYSNTTQFASSMKILDSQYIDNWIFIKVIKNYVKINQDFNDVFDFEKNSAKLTNFTTYMIQGKLFDRTSEPFECQSSLIFSWGYESPANMKISQIKGTFQTGDSCLIPLQLKFSLNISDNSRDLLMTCLYSFVVSLLCVSQFFSTIWLNQQIVDSFTNSNVVSLFTVGQNIVWNAYGCLCHFFLAVNNDDYIVQFGIPAFLYFANFSVFELRLLYNLWKNQNIAELNDINTIRKKLVKFYITFYVFLFLSLFFVTKFYFEEAYILLALIITWSPQIIYNSLYNNRVSLPLINIFLNTFNKILIPIYFRGCSQNIFHIKYNTTFIYICLVIISAQVNYFIYLDYCLVYANSFWPQIFHSM
jgi:hypothetical protein